MSPSLDYPLPLHDALPIWLSMTPFANNVRTMRRAMPDSRASLTSLDCTPLSMSSSDVSDARLTGTARRIVRRSEEHTSELQSPDHPVCRPLLQKKNRHNVR